jgi:hypothetical protein
MEKLPIHSKEAYGDALESTDKHGRARPSTTTYLWRFGIVTLFLAGYYLLLLKPSSHCSGHLQSETYKAEVSQYGKELELGYYDPGASETLSQTKIPLEAHIMSKCPDAQACLQKLVLPVMEKVSDKVDFKLSFIAR